MFPVRLTRFDWWWMSWKRGQPAAEVRKEGHDKDIV